MEGFAAEMFWCRNRMVVTYLCLDKKMGNKCRKLVAEKYEIKVVTTKIIELYHKVLNQKLQHWIYQHTVILSV